MVGPIFFLLPTIEMDDGQANNKTTLHAQRSFAALRSIVHSLHANAGGGRCTQPLELHECHQSEGVDKRGNRI
jgi:hypothetical protein